MSRTDFLESEFVSVLLWSSVFKITFYVCFAEFLCQPWCNPLWLTGLKAPTNKQTNKFLKAQYVTLLSLECSLCWLCSLHPEQFNVWVGCCITVVSVCFVVSTQEYLHAEDSVNLIPTGCYICLLCSIHVHSRIDFLNSLTGFHIAVNRYRQAVVSVLYVIYSEEN